MKKWCLLIVAVLFVGFVTVVFAFGPPFGSGGPPFAADRGFRGSFTGPEGFPGSMPPFARGNFGPTFAPGFPGAFGPMRYLGLSEDQLKKMAALRDRYFQETRDLRYELAEKGLRMRKLFTDPKTDDAALAANQKELSVLRQKLFDAVAQMPIEMRKILTPDQIQKLGQMPPGRFGMGFGRMGFGMRGPAMMGGWMTGPGI
jgi:Spy/CpxP family protein refolding chaperone